MFLIPLMVAEAFSILVIAAQIAALDPLMVTCASTIMVCLLGLAFDPRPHETGSQGSVQTFHVGEPLVRFFGQAAEDDGLEVGRYLRAAAGQRLRRLVEVRGD